MIQFIFSLDHIFTKIVVCLFVEAPGQPHLIAPPQAAFKEGDVFMAQCVVPNGRPAAKITWFLGKYTSSFSFERGNGM